MTNFEIFDKLTEVEKFYTDTQYAYLVPAVEACVDAGQYVEAEKLLNRFPTKKELLDSLVEKLKGKSVYRTLKKLSENEVEDSSTMLKGLSSLLTHITIEVEKGNKEYRALYPLIYERIGKLLYKG